MNMYPEALDALLVGGIDVIADSVRALLVDSGYTYNVAHDFLDDVAGGARVGTAVALTGKSIASGEFFASPATIPAIAFGDTVTGVILYQHTGTESTSHLIAHIDLQADKVPISRLTNGGDIVLTWPSNRIFKI